ncbi:MAG TPA: HYR domain-containing protein [Bacteroidales bacterium]|nr:HYR domain-containing protein [Bacteroidales bacterium]
MKRTGILLITFLIIITFTKLPALAQSGPGGVGDMTNTQLWLRADRGVFTIMPFSAVVQWDDQSGNARNFKPVILDQNVPERNISVINGLPALSFDDMGGVSGAFLGYKGGLGFSGSDAATVIMVARNTSAADEQNGGLYIGQENVGSAGQVRNYSLEYSDAVRFNSESQIFNDGHTAGNWKMVVYSNPSGASVSGYSSWLDGTSLTGGSASSTVPLLTANFSLLGATQYGGTLNPAGFFDGDIAEVVVYSSQLNEASRIVIENSLAAKYNLTITGDHYAHQLTHSYDVSGIAAYNGTTFTNGYSSELLSINSPTDLSDNEYLFYGHDNMSATAWTMTEVPAPGTYRIAREWRVDETSEVGTVTVSIPAASLPAIPAGYNEIAILTDADGDFTSGTTMHRATLTAGIYNLSVNLTSGQYITIIAYRPEINYTIVSASGAESVPSVTVQAFLNYIYPSDVTVDYAVIGGTATPGADFTLAPGTITIPTGSLTGTFNITIINDAILEPDETVIAGLLNPSVGITVGSQNPYTYTILNDDFIYASLSSATASEAEGNVAHGILAPQLVISGGIMTTPGSLVLTVTNGTATAADWSQTTGLIPIPAGDYSTPVSIPVPAAALSILGDVTVENDETINLNINTFSVVMAGAIINCVYTIVNDDIAGFIVNPVNLTIDEGGPAGQFTVVLISQPQTNVVFDLVNAAPVYVTHPAQITFTPANWNVPVVVSVLAIEDALDADRTDLIAVTVNQGLTDNNFDAMAAQNVNININDNDPPVITGCPANITANAVPGACSAVVSWTAPTSSSPMVSTHNPGSTFPVGVTTVTYTSTDNDGMVSTCVFTVTVTDTQPPVMTCPPAIANVPADPGQCYATGVVLGVPLTSDNCAVASVTNNAPAQMPIGTTTVTWTATDVNGLTSTCTQTVQVIDNQIPTITCPLNLTVPSDIGVCGAAVTWSSPVFSDNCAGLTVISSHNSGDFFPKGVTAVTYTVTDGADNTNNCSFNITVTDPEPPSLVTKDITVYLDASGSATIVAADVVETVTDNCPGITLSVSKTVFTCANLGFNVVTVTATDASGNSVNANADVIVADILPPVLTCKNATVNLDAAGNGSVVPADLISVPVTDNCSVASVTLSRSAFTCADLGVVTVTVTATDGSGNVSTCTSSVTVTDAFLASVSAGPDAGICITDPTFTLSSATALNVTVVWTTSGTGTFDNPTLVNPVYTPGAGDAPAVTLTITGTKISGCPGTFTDAMTLTLAGLPSANAGADQEICSGTASIALSDASAVNGSVLWTTSGDGTFSDPAAVTPVYTFGPSDTGPVTLTMTVSNGFCTDNIDNLLITFTPTPMADAGLSASLCSSESGYQVAGASHASGTVLWKTSGNGTFDDPATDNPYYSFGTSDYLSGSVVLTMEVTGGGSCGTAESSAMITINPLPEIVITGLANVTCPGLSDAQINLGVTSGLPPVTYSMEGAPFQASGDFTGLAPGDWYFEVMDGNGCVSDTTITVTEPLPFTVTVDNVTDVTCNGGNSGSVDVTALGGTEPYNVSWIGTAGFTATTPDITGLVAGTYDLTITDLYACATYNFSINIGEPPAISVTGVTLSDHNGFGVTCSSGNDGFINITAGGGTPPLVISWTGPGGFFSSSEDIADLVPGTYTLTVTDAAGCSFTGDYILTAPEPMTVTSTTETGSCPDVADGSIYITVSGGTGTLTYRWDDGVTLDDRPAILPGDHSVTVTDANGCWVQHDVTVDMTGYNCLRVYEIITPNGDGSNDTWKMRNSELYPDAEVLVYNRWGKLVFNTRNASADEWDGTYKGKLLPNDSYHYVIYLNDGSEPRTGVITIISK